MWRRFFKHRNKFTEMNRKNSSKNNTNFQTKKIKNIKNIFYPNIIETPSVLIIMTRKIFTEITIDCVDRYQSSN